MAGERTIKIKIDGDQRGLASAASGSNKALNDLDRGVRRASGGMDAYGKAADGAADKNTKASKSFAGLGSSAALAGVAVGAAVIAWVNATAQAMINVERITAQTTTVIKSMNAEWTNTDAVVGYATNLEHLTGVEQEAIQGGQNLLLTYGQIKNRIGEGNNIFDQATTAMLDLSVATGKDMPAAATLVGKALNDPIKGMAALQKVGVQLTDSQKEQIKAFVESGDVMSAQKVILAELTRQFGGSAKAFGETTAGQVAKLQNRFGELSEEMLANLLPALNSIATAFIDMLNWIDQNSALLRTLAIAVAGLGTSWLLANGAIKLINVSMAAWNAISKLAQGSTAGLGAGFTALSRTAKIASLSMGAIGIIATGIGVAMSIFGGESAEAEAQQAGLAASAREFNSVLREQNGIINQNVVEQANKIAIDNDLFDLARGSGVVSVETVTQALLGQKDAIALVNGAAEKAAAGEHKSQAARAQAIDSATKLAEIIGQHRSEVEADTQANKDAAAAEEEALPLRERMIARAEEQVAILDELIAKRQEEAGVVLSSIDAEIRWNDAVDKATTALAENGATLDLGTEAGRSNQSALNDVAKSTLDLVAAQQANGASNEQLAGTVNAGREQFIRFARQMGATEAQAVALADDLGLIPGDYNARAGLDAAGFRASMRDVDRQLDRLRRERVIIPVTTSWRPGVGPSALNIPGRATGGPMTANQPYRVGERGEEIFVPPNSGTMIPNHQLTGGDTFVTVMIDGQEFRGMIKTEIREDKRGTVRSVGAGVGRSR